MSGFLHLVMASTTFRLSLRRGSSDLAMQLPWHKAHMSSVLQGVDAPDFMRVHMIDWSDVGDLWAIKSTFEPLLSTSQLIDVLG